jgi:hypothetical protein
MDSFKWLVPMFALAVGAALPATASAAPANDDFANAGQLSGPQPIVVRGTTAGATRESADPGGLDPPVWYRWTPAASGQISLELCARNSGVAERTFANLYTGQTRATLDYVPDEGDRFRSGDCPYNQIGFVLPSRYNVVAGTTYTIGVSSSESAQGDFGMVITRFVAPPRNDEFANATVLDGPLPVRSVGDPDDSTDNRLWYRWTAPAGGSFTLESCPEGAADISVFTGSSEPALNPVAIRRVYSQKSMCPLDAGPKGLKEGTEFKATRGTTYVLRVDAVNDSNHRPRRFAIAVRRKEFYDLALRQTVSRRTVPIGGVVVEKLIVTNRSNITIPTPADAGSGVGHAINRPGLPNYAGKARNLSIRSPGAKCSKGFFYKVPVAGCNIKRLAPGERMVVKIRIRVLAPILLEAEMGVDDEKRANDEASVVVRTR